MFDIVGFTNGGPIRLERIMTPRKLTPAIVDIIYPSDDAGNAIRARFSFRDMRLGIRWGAAAKLKFLEELE
jgi:hypothetical protein